MCVCFKRRYFGTTCSSPSFVRKVTSHLVLTLAFEILFGRFAVGASWDRLAADDNVLEGGFLPFGMLILLLSPLLAGKVRGVRQSE
mgnify:CR=1 FL=1